MLQSRSILSVLALIITSQLLACGPGPTAVPDDPRATVQVISPRGLEELDEEGEVGGEQEVVQHDREARVLTIQTRKLSTFAVAY